MLGTMTTPFTKDRPRAIPTPTAASSNSTIATAKRGGAVLLATQGAGASQSPALIARLLAERLGQPLRVVSVIEPITMYAGSDGLSPMPVYVDVGDASEREESVRKALATTWPVDVKYELETRLGGVSREIAAATRDCNADIVIVGAAPHVSRRRQLSGVLAAQVLRHVRCPVLSVTPGLDHLPRQIVAAVDFGEASVRAAREALRLLEDGGTLTLAYAITTPLVAPLLPSAAGTRGAEESMRLLERLREHLQEWAPAGSRIELRVLEGIPDDGVIELAQVLKADLIAVGTHGPGLIERTFIGSTAANVLHLAPCSVLAVQAPSGAQRAELELEAWGTVETFDEHLWGKLLDEFSKRNAERRVNVEVDDLAFGAQLQAAGYTLRGATYDTGDRRVDIMLGAPGTSDAHLVRTISGVTSIGLSRDNKGSDIALQIRTDTSETLVIFG